MSPRLLFYIFKVKYVNIYTENIMNFFIQFSLIKLYKIIRKKIGLGVIILFNICPFLSQLFALTISFFKSRLYMP